MKKYGVNYLKVTGKEALFANELSENKIASTLNIGNLDNQESYTIIAAKNVNKTTLKKIAKSL